MYAKFINLLVFLVALALIVAGIALAVLPAVEDPAFSVPENAVWPLTIVGIVSLGCGVLLAMVSAILALRMSKERSRTP